MFSSRLVRFPGTRGLVRAALFVVVLGAAALGMAALEEAPPKPTGHQVHTVEGWTIQVDQRLRNEEAELGDSALDLLKSRLADIKRALPRDKVIRLQQVTIWLDLTHGDLRAAQYHPSAEWLQDHGYAVSLEKCVHIPDARDFVSRRHQRVQPWSVMHELAHAYHDQVLSFENPQIRAAWEAIRENPQWEKSLHIDGHETRHYGLTNPMEFFAEMSESYLGVNDFYPFNRAELQRDFPEIHRLMKSIWESTPPVAP